MNNNGIHSNSLKKVDIFSTVFILVAGILLTHRLENYMDVLLWDEAIYLDRGFLLWKIIPNTWGPTYSVWYKMLSYIEIDKVNLYYLNYKIQTIGSAILLYLLLRKHSIVQFVSFFLAISWLFHVCNLPSWPKISHFSVQLILVAGIVSSYFSSLLIKSILFCLAFLFCAYARPELYVSFLMSLLVVLYFVIKEIKNINKIKLFTLFVLCFSIFVTYKFYKTPFNGNDSQRSVGVLIQHLAYNINTWDNLNLLWWYEWKSIVAKYFQEPFSLKEIIFNENGIFLKHILYNTKKFLISFVDIILNLFFPYSIFYKKKIFFFAMTILSAWLFIKYFKLDRSNLKKNKFIVLLFFIACFPSIFSSIYAYPRTHYLVMTVPLIWFVVALFLNHCNLKFLYTLLLACLTLMVMPKAENYTYFDMFGTNKNRTNSKLIQHFKNKNTKDSVCLFDADGMLPTLMPQNYTIYDIKSLIANDTFSFGQAMEVKKPDIIVISPTMLKWTKIKNDTLFRDMIANPNKFGYSKKKLKNLDGIFWLEKIN